MLSDFWFRHFLLSLFVLIMFDGCSMYKKFTLYVLLRMLLLYFGTSDGHVINNAMLFNMKVSTCFAMSYSLHQIVIFSFSIKYIFVKENY